MTRLSRRARVVLLGAILLGPVVLVAATPSAAHAQIGWVKKLLGKKKKPAPPAASATQPGAPTAPGAPAGTPAVAGAAGAAGAGTAVSPHPGAPSQADAAAAH